MSTRDQQRHHSEDPHGASVAQLARSLIRAVPVACALAACVLPVVCALAACAGDATAPDEPVDPNDLDGDGIPNAEDLCPRSAHVSQHDEDGDGVGDACDVCPAVFDPAQLDTGEVQGLGFGDRVGDACDPLPARDGDVLAAFHPFTDDTDVRPWHGSGWTIGGDAANAAGTARWEHGKAQPGDGLYVQARVSALAWQASGGHVTVLADVRDEQAAYRCGVVQDRDADGADEYEANVFATTETRSLGEPVTGELVITLWRAIDRDRRGFIFCRVSHAGGPQREILIESDDTASGRYAFSAEGADAAVASLVVYTFPMNPCGFGSKCEPDDPPP